MNKTTLFLLTALASMFITNSAFARIMVIPTNHPTIPVTIEPSGNTCEVNGTHGDLISFNGSSCQSPQCCVIDAMGVVIVDNTTAQSAQWIYDKTYDSWCQGDEEGTVGICLAEAPICYDEPAEEPVTNYTPYEPNRLMSF